MIPPSNNSRNIPDPPNLPPEQPKPTGESSRFGLLNFSKYDRIRRMVKVYCPRNDVAISLRDVCDTVLEMFSPETILDSDTVEDMVGSLLPAGALIFNKNTFKDPVLPLKMLQDV